VLWTGAPDYPVCHRTVSGAPGPYKVQTTTLGFLLALSTIIHRTVRRATGLPGAPAKYGYPAQRSTATAPDERYSARQCQSAPDTEQCLSGVAPDCPVPLEDKASNGHQLPNPNGWVTWLAHRTVSGVPIDSSLPQRLFGG
jgi:hypothetical protein